MNKESLLTNVVFIHINLFYLYLVNSYSTKKWGRGWCATYWRKSRSSASFPSVSSLGHIAMPNYNAATFMFWPSSWLCFKSGKSVPTPLLKRNLFSCKNESLPSLHYIASSFLLKIKRRIRNLSGWTVDNDLILQDNLFYKTTSSWINFTLIKSNTYRYYFLHKKYSLSPPTYIKKINSLFFQI